MARPDAVQPYRSNPPCSKRRTSRRSDFSGTCQAGPGLRGRALQQQGRRRALLRRRLPARATSSIPHEFVSPRDAGGPWHARRDRRSRGNSVTRLCSARGSRRYQRNRAARTRRGLQGLLAQARTKSTRDLRDVGPRARDRRRGRRRRRHHQLLRRQHRDRHLTAPDDLALLERARRRRAHGRRGRQRRARTRHDRLAEQRAVGDDGRGIDARRNALRRGDRDPAPASSRGDIVTMREASFTPAAHGRPTVEGAASRSSMTARQTLGDGGRARRATPASTRQRRRRSTGKHRAGRARRLLVRGEDHSASRTPAPSRAIVYNDCGDADNHERRRPAASHIPAVMIGTADGQDLVDALVERHQRRGAPRERRARASAATTGNKLADFSSRGPAVSDAELREARRHGARRRNSRRPFADTRDGLRGEHFQYHSGTSMASPEAAGIVALLKEAHPELVAGDAQIGARNDGLSGRRSSGRRDARESVRHGRGAHRPEPRERPRTRLRRPSYLDHAAYLCGLEGAPLSPAECDALAAAGLLERGDAHLNLPSIARHRAHHRRRREAARNERRARRRAIEPQSTSHRRTSRSRSIPPTLVLATGETAEFSLRFERTQRGARCSGTFGQLTWTDGKHTVVSPIAVQPGRAARARARSALTGTSAARLCRCDFGYGGPYIAGAHGLRAPLGRGGPVLGARRRRPDQYVQFPRRTRRHGARHFTVPPGNYICASRCSTSSPTATTISISISSSARTARPTTARKSGRAALHFGRTRSTSRRRRPACTSRWCTASRPIRSRAAPARTTRCSSGRSASTTRRQPRRDRGRGSVNEGDHARPRLCVGAARARDALPRRRLSRDAVRPLLAHDPSTSRRGFSRARAAAFPARGARKQLTRWSLTRPGRLHVRIDDRRADELEPTRLQVLAQRVGLRLVAANLASARASGSRSASPPTNGQTYASKLPNSCWIARKARALRDRSLDLLTVTDDARVLHEPRRRRAD